MVQEAMSYAAALTTSAGEFLATTNAAYDECAGGISTLDKIIVGVPSSLAPATRTNLVPILYAYWERFFRLTFSEFVRCVSLAQIPLSKMNSKLARFRLKHEFKSFLESAKIAHLAELAAVLDIDEARKRIGVLHLSIDAPLVFDRPTECVVTHSNVKYVVLEENCGNLGIDLGAVRAVLEDSKMVLFVELNALVDSRNQIAHGESLLPMENEPWEKTRNFTLNLMNAVQLVLHEIIGDPAKLLRL